VSVPGPRSSNTPPELQRFSAAGSAQLAQAMEAARKAVSASSSDPFGARDSKDRVRKRLAVRGERHAVGGQRYFAVGKATDRPVWITAA